MITALSMRCTSLASADDLGAHQIDGNGGRADLGVVQIPGGRLDFRGFFSGKRIMTRRANKPGERQENEAQAHIEKGVGIGDLPGGAGSEAGADGPHQVGESRNPEKKQQDTGHFEEDVGQRHPFGFAGGSDSGQDQR
jgi:hypothetical protein